MFCPKCGTQVNDGASFCPKCGTALAQQPAVAPEQPTPQQAPAPEQSAYQQQQYQQQQTYQQAPSYQAAPQPTPAQGFHMPSLGELFCGHNTAAVQYAEASGLKMKWYKALVIALLYLGALANLVMGLQYLTGNGYGEASGSAYAFFPALRVVDVLYGIVSIALVFAVLYTRMRLAQFASDGPRLYLTLLLVNLGVGFVYSLLSSVIINNLDYLTLVGSLAMPLAMYVLNRTYFEKRQHLFTA